MMGDDYDDLGRKLEQNLSSVILAVVCIVCCSTAGNGVVVDVYHSRG